MKVPNLPRDKRRGDTRRAVDAFICNPDYFIIKFQFDNQILVQISI